jgi:hypothetical protein
MSSMLNDRTIADLVNHSDEKRCGADGLAITVSDLTAS